MCRDYYSLHYVIGKRVIKIDIFCGMPPISGFLCSAEERCDFCSSTRNAIERVRKVIFLLSECICKRMTLLVRLN